MIKYEIRIIPKVEGFIMTEYKYKTVNKSELKEYLNKGWEVYRKKYFLITYLSDSWRGLSTTNKISIIAMILATGIGILALI